MSGISVHIAFQAWKGIRIVPPLPPRWNAAQSLFLAINTVVLLCASLWFLLTSVGRGLFWVESGL